MSFKPPSLNQPSLTKSNGSGPEQASPVLTAESPAPSRWNVPNALGVFRLVGSFVLIGVALLEHTSGFVVLMIALLLSDWFDGKIAILWNQRTPFGARLDSVADAAMYGAMLFGTCWLQGRFVLEQWPWIAGALATYALTTGAGWIKYRRIPSYHTRAAKTSWLLVSIAAITVFAEGPVWPFQWAMVVVMLTNLEATVMTSILPVWLNDIPSVFHAWQWRQRIRTESAATADLPPK